MTVLLHEVCAGRRRTRACLPTYEKITRGCQRVVSVILRPQSKNRVTGRCQKRICQWLKLQSKQGALRVNNKNILPTIDCSIETLEFTRGAYYCIVGKYLPTYTYLPTRYSNHVCVVVGKYNAVSTRQKTRPRSTQMYLPNYLILGL